MDKKNILFISISFPPKRDSESLQVSKYFKALNQVSDEYNYTVITSGIPTLNMPYEKSLETYNTGFHHKIEVNIPESRYINFALRKFLPFTLQQPDSKYTFHKRWQKVIAQIREHPDLIYSRSYPLSSTMLGYRLARYFDIPWVLHLSDPWSFYPLQALSKKGRKYHEYWEEKCFDLANKIGLTSQETIARYQELYPKYCDKFILFPNVYEKPHLNQQPIRWGDKMRIVYTGGLIGERSLKWIINPLKELVENSPQIGDQLELVFCGEMDRENKAFFNTHKSSVIVNKGVLSFEASRKLQQSAHLLLLIDNPLTSDQRSAFFPSKLLDYFLAQRKVLAITPPKSTSENILKKMNGKSIVHEDHQEVKQVILEALEQFKNKNEDYFISNELPSQFDANYQAKRLIDTFKELI